MAEELEGVYTTLHLKVAEQDFKKAQDLMLKIADNKAVKDGFDKVEKGLGGISQTAEKQYKSIQGLNAITAKGFNELAKATDSLIGKIEELGKQSEKASKETQKSIKQAVDEAKEQVDGIDSLITKGAGVVGGYFAVDALKGYLGNMMAVRSQFQSIEYSMRILLGSEEKAKNMFEDIKKFAVDTPMDMQGIASAAQLMMGFGIDSGEVMKNLRALGDVAMGDAQRFQSLSLAFSQMSAAGKLMGQDLLQMINAGFNPLQQMAKDTGKTIGELKAEMSAGLITADMAKQAFWNAASEGGKYYGMMELQATTIKGQQEKLNDAVDAMYNEIAEYLEGGIIQILKFGGELIEHWKEVARYLGALVTAYGAYRAAIMITTATQKAAAIAERALAMARKEATIQTKAATTAHVLYNQAANGIKGALNMVKAMINPWTLLAVAIGAATTAIVLHLTKETEMEKAQKSLAKITDEYNQSVAKEQRNVDQLFGKLQALSKGTEKYNTVKQQIISQYGEYLKSLGEEKQTLEDIAGAYKAITAAIREKYKTQALDRAYSAYIDNTEKGKSDALEQFNSSVDKGKWGDAVVDKVRVKEQVSNLFEDVRKDMETQLEWYYQQIQEGKENMSFEELYRTVRDQTWRDVLENNPIAKQFMGAKGGAAEGFHYLRFPFYDYTEKLFAQWKTWKDATIAFGRNYDIVLPEETTTNDDEKPPKSTPTTDDPNIKALNDLKKKTQEKIKIGKQIAALYSQLQQTYKEIDEAWGVDEATKNEQKSKAAENTTFAINKLLAEHPDFTAQDKSEIDKYWADVSGYSQERAKEEYLKLAAEKAELEKQLAEDKTKKLSKKKGADNTSTIADNKKALDDYEKNRQRLEELTIKTAVLQDILDEPIDMSKWEEKTAAFQQFASDYSKMLTESEKELKDLKREYDAADTGEEKSLISKRIEYAMQETEFQKQRLINDFKAEYGEDMPTDIMEFIASYMAQVTDMTIGQINAEILKKGKELKTLKDEAKKNGKDLSKEIAKIQAELDTLSGIKTIKLNIEPTEFQKAQKQVKNLTSAFKELGSTIGGSTQDALNMLSNVVDTSMALASNIVDFTKFCKDLIVSVQAEGLSAIKAMETASVILEIISLIMQLGFAIANCFKDEEAKQFREQVAALREEIRDFLHELELERMNSKAETIFGADYWGRLATNIKIATDANRKWQKVQEDTIKGADVLISKGKDPAFGDVYEWEDNDQIYNFWKGSYAPTSKGIYNNIDDAVGNMKVKKKHKTWFRAEESDSLRNQFPELFDDSGKLIMDTLDKLIGSDVFGKLSGENQEYIKEMSKAWEEYKTYLQSAKDAMADFMGGIGNNIGDMFVNAFKTGESCIDEFEQTWDLALENMVNSTMYHNFLQPIFEDAQKRIEDTGFYEDPDAHFDEVLDILEDTKQASAKTQEKWDNVMKEAQKRGLYESGSQRSTLQGGIANVTQDTAEEMNGRLTQIQSHTYSINEQMKSMHELAASQLEILQGIKGDTARLESIETNIAELNHSVSTMQLYGVKMK